MKLTEQQFLDGLTTDQASYFNARLISIRDEFQASYAASVASVSAAKDHLLVDKTAEFEAEKSAHAATKAVADTVPTITAERDALQTQVDAIPDLQEQIKTLTAEVERLTALVPPPVDPNAVPATITRTQARLVLHRAGLLENVLKVIEAGGVEAQIWYVGHDARKDPSNLSRVNDSLIRITPGL